VRDYDEALAFYVGKLGFSLIEDTYQPAQDKRWVVVSPPGATESALLLARASTEHQATRVGDQTGGRVFLFLYTDDFGRDFNAYKSKGVKVIREPKTEDYGTVAVFHDLHGNQWDLTGFSDRRIAGPGRCHCYRTAVQTAGGSGCARAISPSRL
jgi:catechol 2,3-dioxygenase-like lactoylglutathione lyase family enzyme